jgi:hypothetical protein
MGVMLCKHGLSPHACTHCQHETKVYVTGEGSTYHSSRSCSALKSGQAIASDQGSDTTPITSVILSEAVEEGRRACKSCW